MATTFILKRKTFANPAAIAKTLGQAKAAGFTKSGFQWFGGGNLGSAISGTKTMKAVDGATQSAVLNRKERVWEAAKGIGKLGATTAVVGTAIGAKKVDDAANGLV